MCILMLFYSQVSVPQCNVIKLPSHSHTDLPVKQSTLGRFTTGSPETQCETAENGPLYAHTHTHTLHLLTEKKGEETFMNKQMRVH